MSAETSEWLNNNVAVGFTEKRGDAWWLRAGDAKDGWESHFTGAVPEKVALDLLGRIQPVKVTPKYDWTNPATGETVTKVDDDAAYIINSLDGSKLGVHSDGYAIHGYTDWLIRNAERITGTGLEIGQCGLLKNGAQAWVSFELPETVEYKRSFTSTIEYRPQLLATTALDGSLATTYKMVFTIVVCDNTRSMALGENGAVYRIKHTKNSEVKIAGAREALELTYAMADDFKAELDTLTGTKVSTRQWDAFKELYVPIDPDAAKRGVTMANDKRDLLNELYETDPMCAPWNGTAYGVIQTVNTWAHHKAIVRKVTPAERNMQNALTGKTAKLDAQVWATLNKVLTGATA